MRQKQSKNTVSLPHGRMHVTIRKSWSSRCLRTSSVCLSPRLSASPRSCQKAMAWQSCLSAWKRYSRHRTLCKDTDSVSLLVLSLVPCTDQHPLPRSFILDYVVTRPMLAKLSHTFSRAVKGLNYLDKLQSPVALHPVNANGRIHQTPMGDRPIRRGQSRDYRSDGTWGS
jgi:hypothetical protein